MELWRYGSKFRTPLHANVSLRYQTFKFKETNVFLAPDTFYSRGKRLRDVNDKNEIKASFPSCGFVPSDRYSDIPVCLIVPDESVCDATGNSRLTLLIEISPVRHAGTRVVLSVVSCSIDQLAHDHLGHAFSASSLSHLARSRRRIESEAG